MANLTIRNVDDRVVEKLKERARKKGHSLAAEVRQILTEDVRRPSRGAELRALADRIAAMTPKEVKQTDSAKLIREDRDR